MLPDLSAVQWALGAFAGALIGFSKTGVPGAGILVIPVMAAIFGGRSSVGTLLPMLIFADCFAVLWYRRHTRWDKLIVIIPWVALGMAIGAWFLQYLGEVSGTKDVLSQIIGWLVLVMLAVHLARSVWGDRLVPHSRAAAASTGAAAGFATTVSNAAGPIMTIYFQGMGLNKEQFLGSFAWYFFIFNMTKVPIFMALTMANPAEPLFTVQGFLFDLIVLPAIVLGAYLGKWLVAYIPQKAFDTVILILAAAAAMKLVAG